MPKLPKPNVTYAKKAPEGVVVRRIGFRAPPAGPPKGIPKGTPPADRK